MAFNSEFCDIAVMESTIFVQFVDFTIFVDFVRILYYNKNTEI